MKVTAIKCFPIMAWRPHLFVKVETDEGIHGMGEAGLTWQEAAVVASVERLATLLVGQDPMRIEHLWQVMFRAGFFPGDKVACAAISAIDIALWDLKGKTLDQPIHRLLGGPVRDKVVCYPHNRADQDPSHSRLIESCQRTSSEGWRFVRWGLPPAEEGEFEPLAAGEQWTSKWGFRAAIEEDLIQYARIDLSLVGGITEACKITHWADAHYINIAPHNPLGPVSTAAGTQLCLASTNVGVLEMALQPGTDLTDVFPVQTPFDKGYALPSAAPGLGIEFDEEAAARYPTPEAGFAPLLRRRDGAFTNW